MDIKQTIKAIIQSGGSVRYPYKRRLPDYLESEELCAYYPGMGGQPRYLIHPSGLGDPYNDLDEAINAYCTQIFSHSNIGLALVGIRKHNLTDKDLDDVPDRELRKLIKLYWAEYFQKDYGAIDGSNSPTMG